jgi:ketosteroid isomerase-like protein
MNLRSLQLWLDAYGRAWETRDPRAAGLLFTEDATYQETPFDKPMRGRSEIVEYWSHVPRTQEDIHFSHETVTVTGDIAIVHWCASFTRMPSNSKVKLDGIFLLNFGSDNQCKSLREWWVRQER